MEIDIDSKFDSKRLMTLWNRKLAFALDTRCPATGKPLPLYGSNHETMSHMTNHGCCTILCDGSLIYFFCRSGLTREEVDKLIEDDSTVEVHTDLSLIGMLLVWLVDHLSGFKYEFELNAFIIRHPQTNCSRLDMTQIGQNQCFRLITRILEETRDIVLPVHLLAERYLKVGQYVAESISPIVSREPNPSYHRSITSANERERRGIVKSTIFLSKITEYQEEDFAGVIHEEIDLTNYSSLGLRGCTPNGIMRPKSHDVQILERFSYKTVMSTYQSPSSNTNLIYFYIGDEVLLLDTENMYEQILQLDELLSLHCHSSYLFKKSENPTLQAAEPQEVNENEIHLVYIHHETCHWEPKAYHQVLFSLYFKTIEPILKEMNLLNIE